MKETQQKNYCFKSRQESVLRIDGSCTGKVIIDGAEHNCPVENCLALQRLEIRQSLQKEIPVLGVAN